MKRWSGDWVFTDVWLSVPSPTIIIHPSLLGICNFGVNLTGRSGSRAASNTASASVRTHHGNSWSFFLISIDRPQPSVCVIDRPPTWSGHSCIIIMQACESQTDQRWEIMRGDNHLEMTTGMMHRLCNPRAGADLICQSACPRVIVNIWSFYCFVGFANPPQNSTRTPNSSSVSGLREDEDGVNDEGGGQAVCDQSSHLCNSEN